MNEDIGDVESVLFDVGLVLINPDCASLARELSVRLNMTVDALTCMYAYRRTIRDRAHASGAGRLSLGWFWSNWARYVGLEARQANQIQEIVEALEARPQRYWNEAAPAARSVLKALKSKNIRIAAVSNAGTELKDDLQRARLLDCFDCVIGSDEVGLEKPDPEIFRVTLRALGGSPARALMIGDDEVMDVRPAKSASMRAILFDPLELGAADLDVVTATTGT